MIDSGVVREQPEAFAGDEMRRIAEQDFHAGANLCSASGWGRRARDQEQQRWKDVRTSHGRNVPIVSALRSATIFWALATLAAQPLRPQDRPPRRPPLPAPADTNDWEAYYGAGVEWLNQR